jgi:hypothetical protein
MLVMDYFIKGVNVLIGVMQCLHLKRQNFSVKRIRKKQNIIIIKSSSIMFYRMENELIVHGIRQDEDTSF